MKLVLCTHCRRHVRSAEPSCPFCGTAREGEPIDDVVVRSNAAPRRLGRSAMFAMAAAAAVGCSDGETPSPGGDGGSQTDAPQTPDSVVVPVYGAPADTGVRPDSSPPDLGPAPVYGAPPDTGPRQDSSAPDSAIPDTIPGSDASLDAADSGDASDADANRPDLGGPIAIYGAPPLPNRSN